VGRRRLLRAYDIEMFLFLFRQPPPPPPPPTLLLLYIVQLVVSSELTISCE